MIDDVVKENLKEHNPISLQILGHPYKILIIGCSESEKANSLFNLINYQPDIEKIYLYAKGLNEAKYKFLIKKLLLNKLKLSQNTQMTWMILTKTLKNTTQIRKVKH